MVDAIDPNGIPLDAADAQIPGSVNPFFPIAEPTQRLIDAQRRGLRVVSQRVDSPPQGIPQAQRSIGLRSSFTM